MRVISKRPLVEFWSKELAAQGPMEDWYAKAERADWSNFAEVRVTFPQTDLVSSSKGQKLVFDVRGNRYLIVCVVRFDRKALYVLFAGNHADYDRLDIENL